MSRVLIIDDDSDTCELLSIILTEAKHEVFFATNGRAGLDLVRSTRPEVVVVDIFMPEMDGLTVISEVRRQCPTVKIIAMSAGMMTTGVTDLLDLAPDAGADLVLRKSIDPYVLQKTIARLVAAA